MFSNIDVAIAIFQSIGEAFAATTAQVEDGSQGLLWLGSQSSDSIGPVPK